MVKRVAIIGGGIAGLSAAYYLEKARRGGAAIEWTLFEKTDRLGGVIQTEHRDGFVLEAGPDSFLTAKPPAANLCRELGLSDQLIGSNDAQRKTYIVVKRRLVPIPEGLQFMVPTRIWPMVTTRLFSWSSKWRLAREYFSSPGSQDHDEPVGDFVRRHFGQEMVERVAEPLLAGVYGGDAATLSLRAVLPHFFEMELQYGSLVRGTLKERRQGGRSSAPRRLVTIVDHDSYVESPGRSVAAPQPLFTSLKSGMQQMVDALVSSLPPGPLRLGRQDVALRRVGDAWEIASAGNAEAYDAVLLAVPAPAAASLLDPVKPELAALLAKIQYTSSAAVVLAYDRAALPPGFGFLVPRSEGRKMLACTFVHNKLSNRAPEGSQLLRCFFSSSRVRGLLRYSDNALLDLAQRELHDIIGLTAIPRFARVFRWERGLPQYTTGHLERVGEMREYLDQLPGVRVIGNSFYGIGIPDCVRSAMTAADNVIYSGLRQVSA